MEKTKHRYLTKEDLTNIPRQTIVILERSIGKFLAQRIIAEMISYKDIEDEFGIDLFTISKLLKQGFIYVRTTAGIEKNKGFNIDNLGLWSQEKLDPKNYGKKELGGWALTKEELE